MPPLRVEPGRLLQLEEFGRGGTSGSGSLDNSIDRERQEHRDAVDTDDTLDRLARRGAVEVVDDDMAAVFSRMTGAERLQVASQMFSSARRMLSSHLRALHPDWDDRQIVREVARRLSHGAV